VGRRNSADTSSIVDERSIPEWREDLVVAISKVEGVVEHLHEHVERSTFRKWGRP
jgi:hypothetical protein